MNFYIMDNTKIEFRESVTSAEAQLFQKWLKQEPDITGLSAQEILHAKKVIVATKNNTMAGFCTIDQPIQSCAILSSLYVHPDFRAQGIGRELFKRQIGIASRPNQLLVSSSRNPHVLAWLKDAGFTQYPSIWQLPKCAMFSLMAHAWSFYRLQQYIQKKTHGMALNGFQYAVRSL